MKIRQRAITALILLAALPLAAEKLAEFVEVNRPESIQFHAGRIFIMEGTRIFIYDAGDYRLINRFGKRGEGPGEIKKMPFGGPLLMVPHGEKIYISSMGKFSVFSIKGSFEKETKIGITDSYYPFADRFIALTTVSSSSGQQVLAVYLADKKLQKSPEPLRVSDIEVGQTAGFRFPMTAFFPIPYEDKLFLAPDTDAFRIFIFDKEGKKIHTIEKKYEPRKMNAGYRKKTLNWFQKDPAWKNIYPYFKDRISFRDFFPPIREINVDSDRIYALTYVFNGEGLRECIILDLQGEEIKRVFLPVRPNYGMDFNAVYTFHDGRFYHLKENFDEETWELHRLPL